MLLVHIAYLHSLAHGESAGVGLFQAHDEAEQSGFAAPVGADDAHDAGGWQTEGEVFVQQFVAVCLAHALHFQHLVAQARAVGDEYFEVLLFLLHILVHHAVVGGQTGFALGVACLGGHAHPFQLALEGLAAFALLLLLHGQPLGLLVQPAAVVALPGDALATVQLQNPACHVVEEIAVVRDGDDGTFILAQVLLQPVDALSVEMVGRLVEQQYVGFLQQQTAQRHTAALAAAEVLDGSVLVGAAQGIHGAFQPAVQIPGVVLLQQFGQLALPLAQLVEIGIGLGKGVVHLLIFL